MSNDMLTDDNIVAYLKRQHRYLPLSEVAHRMGINREKIRAMLRSGTLPGRKIGDRWKVDSDSLANWLAQDQARSIARKAIRRESPSVPSQKRRQRNTSK